MICLSATVYARHQSYDSFSIIIYISAIINAKENSTK